MAEGLLRFHLERARCDGVEVASAGTWANSGSPATSVAQATMAGRDVDISDHVSRPLTADELEAADIVVAMTSVHVREIAEVAPEAASKVVLIKAVPEMPAAGGGGLEALLAAPRPEWHRAQDLDDPIGLPFYAYERCARELEAGIEALVEWLCAPEEVESGGAGRNAENEPDRRPPP
jgi:protein-tyrosine-phosphatase